MNFCPSCGHQIENQTLKFCSYCGFEFNKLSTTKIQQQEDFSNVSETATNSYSKTNNHSKLIYLSLIGAIVIFVSFFLPWDSYQRSGWYYTQQFNEMFLLFLSSLTIIVLFFVFKSKDKLKSIKIVIMLMSVFVILMTLYGYQLIEEFIQNWYNVPLGAINSEKGRPSVGIYLSLLGSISCFIGSLTLIKRR